MPVLEPIALVVAGAFILGLAIGALVMRARGPASRVAELERELAEARQESEAYRDAVAKHFTGTADRFRDLTRQYADLYAHLAEGARSLAADHAPELTRGFADPNLTLAAGDAPSDATEAEGGGFDELWQLLQAELAEGIEIPNWTRDSGLTGDPFTIVGVDPTSIEVDPPGADIQRIPRGDFEEVHEVWSAYLSGEYPRDRIRDDLTRFSKYIISIFHWIEARAAEPPR